MSTIRGTKTSDDDRNETNKSPQTYDVMFSISRLDLLAARIPELGGK